MIPIIFLNFSSPAHVNVTTEKLFTFYYKNTNNKNQKELLSLRDPYGGANGSITQFSVEFYFENDSLVAKVLR